MTQFLCCQFFTARQMADLERCENQRSSRNSPFAHGLLLYEAPKQHQVQYGNYDPDRVEQVFRKGGVAEFAHDLFR